MGGEKSYKSNRYLKNSSTKVIKSHALDYDLYLNEEDKKYFIQSREDRIKKPLKSLLNDKEKSKIKLFKSLITLL